MSSYKCYLPPFALGMDIWLHALWIQTLVNLAPSVSASNRPVLIFSEYRKVVAKVYKEARVAVLFVDNGNVRSGRTCLAKDDLSISAKVIVFPPSNGDDTQKIVGGT